MVKKNYIAQFQVFRDDINSQWLFSSEQLNIYTQQQEINIDINAVNV